MNIKKNRQSEMSKDLGLAKRICQELRDRNDHAALELMALYGRYLEAFARRRVGKMNLPEMDSEEWIKDLLQGFWIEKILEEKVICRYQGRNGASLKTFLYSVMRNYISQQFREIIRRRETFIDDMPVSWEPPPPSGKNEDTLIKEIDTAEVPVDDVQEKLNREFVDMALENLSSKRPEDAQMISLWMKDGLTYWQIAQKNLEAQGFKLDDDTVRKKAAALRKQFTRPETGSLARFAVIYMKILAEKGYEFEMIENMPILKRAASKYLC